MRCLSFTLNKPDGYGTLSSLHRHRHGKLVESIMCLPHKHQDLIFVPRLHMKKPGLAVHACNPGAGGRDRQVPGAQWPSILTSKRQASESCMLKKEGGWPLRNDTWGWPLASTCVHVNPHECMGSSACTHKVLNTELMVTHSTWNCGPTWSQELMMVEAEMESVCFLRRLYPLRASHLYCSCYCWATCSMLRLEASKKAKT